jgi:hypothetical protein
LIAAWLLLFGTVLVYYPSRAEDYDIFYHLRFGEYFVTHHTFQLDHSIFSWTPADSSWRYGIWLGSTALYLAYRAFGPAGFFIIQWGIFLAIVLLYLRFVRKIGGRVGPIHVFSLLLAFVALNLTAIYIKPELFSTLFFAVSAFIYIAGKTGQKRLLWLHPPLFLLWVNTHGGYLAGLTFLGIALAGEVLNGMYFQDRRMVVPLATVFVLSCIAVMFNPYGPAYHVGIINTFIGDETYMSYARRVYAWVDMWRYLFPKDEFAFRFVDTAWCLVIMIGSFSTLVAYRFVKTKRADVALILVNAAFFWEGMSAARVTIFLPLIWLFSMVYLAHEEKS